MAKALAVDSFSDMQFPAFGLDLSQGYDSQRPNTTNIGLNVRLYEPSTMRARGGNRPGLTKYNPSQLPSGAHLVQLLDTIVSVPGIPSGIIPPGFTLPDPATLDVPFIGPGAVMDPSDAGPVTWWGITQNSRNPGRTVRPGGSGILRYKNKVQQKQKIKFVQSVGAAWNSPLDDNTQTFPITYNANVTAGNFLFVTMGGESNLRITSVSDSFGNSWQPVSDGVDPAGYYTINSGTGPCTITVSKAPFFNTGDYVVALEYSGVNATPADGAASTPPTASNSLATYNVIVPVSLPGGLVIAVYQPDGGNFDAPTLPSFTAGSGFNFRNSGSYEGDSLEGSAFGYLFVADLIGASSGTSIQASGTYTPDFGAGWYVSGASFKQA